jgi:hypothetical protein
MRRKATSSSRRVLLRPSFAHDKLASDEAISERAVEAVWSTKRLFSTRFRQIKGSGTPANALSYARTQAACGTRHGERRLAPPSACGRARLPAFHLRFSPAGLSSRRLSIGPGFPKAARKLRRAARTVSGHSDAPRTPVVVPAGMMPEPPGCGPYLSARGRRTRSAVREYPPGRRPLKSEISRRYCHRRGEVKRVAFSLMNYGASRRAAFSERRSTPMILWWRPNNSSPRLRGEVGLRSNPGEGASPSCSG